MVKRILLIAVTFSVLVFTGLLFLGSRTEPVYIIESEVILPADVALSWQVLTDFSKYPEWNPYVPRIEGQFAEGEKLSFTVVDANFEAPLDLQAELGEIVLNEHFHWSGMLLMPGLHDTLHGFILLDRGDGTTQLRHYEEFRGILPRVLPDRERRIAKTKASFQKMNEALKGLLTDE
jgi:hypothetical protein